MKKMVIALALLSMASTAMARDDGEASKPKNDGDKMICRTKIDTGSRLGGKRECHTAAEWEQLRRETGDAMRRAGSNTQR